jgi:hypothetical protein
MQLRDKGKWPRKRNTGPRTFGETRNSGKVLW